MVDEILKESITNLREDLYKKHGRKCQLCGKEEGIEKLVIHYPNQNCFVESRRDGELLCKECHDKLHGGKNGHLKNEKETYNKLKNAAKEILSVIFSKEELENNQHLVDTPRRVAAAIVELCGLNLNIEKEVEETVELFKATSHDMIVVNATAITLCPHHLLPCDLKINIGIIPDQYLLGISKYQRMAKLLAKKPIIQEEYTDLLADTLMESSEPQGIIVVVTGRHSCIRIRGALFEDSIMTTSAVRGLFSTDKSLEEKFYKLMK